MRAIEYMILEILDILNKKYNLVDKTILSTGEFTIVSPGEYHLFEATKDTIAFELYWAKFDADDIVRETQGGTV